MAFHAQLGDAPVAHLLNEVRSMRRKSENERRDHFARKLAAVKTCELFASSQDGRPGPRTVTVEAEDEPEWDDVVEERLLADGNLRTHRWQVKRQNTDMAENAFKKLVAAAQSSTDQHHFAVCSWIEVTDVGSLRILDGLCQRIQQGGSSDARVCANLRRAERDWVDWIKEQSDCDDIGAMALLRRFRVHTIGFEEDLRSRGSNALGPHFGPQTEAAWAALLSQVYEVDGVVTIDADLVEGWLKQAGVSRVSAQLSPAYATLIVKIEELLWFESWEGLTDHLVRGILPLNFHEDCLKFIHWQSTLAWPRQLPEVEAAAANAAELIHEYLTFFKTRSEGHGRALVEDKSWKRIFPNPNYDKEALAAEEWRRGSFNRLNNMVVGLNELLAAVRSHVDPEYRMEGGRLAIHDSLGVYNGGEEGIYWIPADYVDWD